MYDTIYSLSLLTSLLAGGFALVSSLVARMLNGRPRQRLTRWRRRAGRGSVIAGLALAVSVGVHLTWGHRPGGPQALAPLDFLVEHGSFLIAAALPLLARILAHGTETGRR